jgi:hypothetical protein
MSKQSLIILAIAMALLIAGIWSHSCTRFEPDALATPINPLETNAPAPARVTFQPRTNVLQLPDPPRPETIKASTDAAAAAAQAAARLAGSQ